MLRRCVVLITLVIAAPVHAEDGDDCACDVTPAACDAGCTCDSECTVDWSVDECADPAAGCLANATLPDDATLDATEQAMAAPSEPVEWTTGAVTCPDGTTADNGACLAFSDAAATPTAGCSAGRGAGVIVVLAIAVLLVLRRRRLALALAIAACTQDPVGWDDAVDAGLPGDAYVDVFAADVGDGAQYLLANQPLAANAEQPVAAFALSRSIDSVPISRVATACGDQLVPASKAGGELLGWARAEPGAGTAELVELVATNGCFAYETDPDAIAGLVAEGYTVTGTVGHVWPPGMSDPPVAEDPTPEPITVAGPAPCTITKHSAVELLYSSPGSVETLRFLIGCPGEVIVGEKREGGPVGSMKSAAAHAAGGRTAFVLDRHGDKLRALLGRANGVERTAAYLRHKLQIGYDYIVLDEVTTAGDYADGESLNRKLRALLLRIPMRSMIPYISIDLTQQASSIYMHNRRNLLRAFKRRGRALALEVYLHTGQVMAGAAPAAFRRAADRLALAVHGLSGTAGINRAAFVTIGTSMHSTFAQYRYLDQPSHDLAALTREVNAIRHGSKRLRSQHGIGWYFVGKSDMATPGAYTYDALIKRMRTQALRFR